MKREEIEAQETLRDVLYLARVVACSFVAAVAWIVFIGTVLS